MWFSKVKSTISASGMTVYDIYTLTLNWQGRIRSGQGCLSVLLCCFSLRVRPVHVLQAPCGQGSGRCLTLRPPAGLISAFSRKRNEAYWTVHPLTTTQKMPKSDCWRRVSPCQFRADKSHINFIPIKCFHYSIHISNIYSQYGCSGHGNIAPSAVPYRFIFFVRRYPPRNSPGKLEYNALNWIFPQTAYNALNCIE